MSPLRAPLLLLARSQKFKAIVSTVPVSAGIVGEHVPGETTESALGAVAELAESGLASTLDFLGEDIESLEQAEDTIAAYTDVLTGLSVAGLAGRAEVSVKLTALGQSLGENGEKTALENARAICRAARNAGTTVTLDMEGPDSVDSTLGILTELRKDFPETGAVLQSYLPRTEDDCRALAHEGSRVRLCKGAYALEEGVTFESKAEIDKSYVRCMKVLMGGEGYPMLATHDPRLIEIASSLASRYGRAPGTYEFQMLYGIRPEEQKRLARAGESVRVYIPYGHEWYGYLMRRLAERPQNVAFFLRSLISKK